MTDTISADTDAKQSILDRIATCVVDAPELPEVDASRVIEFDDPMATFSETLEFVGGQVHQVAGNADIAEILNQIEVFRDAKRIVSLVDDLVDDNIDASLIDDPHALATVDWMIAKGEFMVAENGAIWVDGQTLPHRVLLFIAQYLAIVVPKSQIVSNMHQAYTRIEGFAERFGVFVSGPSKTADIEQSLVLGAHGCRKLHVFVTDS